MSKIKLDKKNKIAIGVVIGLIVCIIFGATFNIYRNVKELFGSTTKRPEIVDSDHESSDKEIGTYVLHSNPTSLQQEIYDELKAKMDEYSKGSTEELSFDICGLVAKSFVADFYTWTNKVGNYDVGGMDYVYGPNHLNISTYARDTFYNDLDLYIKDYGSKDLLEVDSITVNVSYAEPYVLDDEHTFNSSFYVLAKWTYKNSNVLNTADFQNRGSFIIVYNENNKRFEIVSLVEYD